MASEYKGSVQFICNLWLRDPDLWLMSDIERLKEMGESRSKVWAITEEMLVVLKEVLQEDETTRTLEWIKESVYKLYGLTPEEIG